MSTGNTLDLKKKTKKNTVTTVPHTKSCSKRPTIHLVHMHDRSFPMLAKFMHARSFPWLAKFMQMS